MKTYEFFNLICAFDNEDYRKFKDYLCSPFFNNPKSLSNIYDIIFNNRKLLAEKNYAQLFILLKRNSGYGGNTIKKILSMLCNTLLEYYKTKIALKDNLSNDLTLNRFLLKNKFYNVLEKRQNQLTEYFENCGSFSRDFLYKKFQHQNNILSERNINKSIAKPRKDITLDLSIEALISLYVYFLMETAISYTNIFMLKTKTDTNKDSDYLIKINKLLNLANIENLKLEDNKTKIIYNLYKKLLCFISDLTNKNKYLQYKRYYLKNINLLDFELKAAHHNILMNFCAFERRINQDYEYFTNEMYLLLKNYTEKEYYKDSENDYLDHETYRNFIVICLEKKSYNEIYEFQSNNKKNLNPKFRRIMEYYSLAYYYFYTKNYQKCSKYINDINFNQYWFKYDIRNLELKLLYELRIKKKNNRGINYTDLLEKALHNYREIIFSDKNLHKTEKSNFDNTLKNYAKLLYVISILDKNKKEEEARCLYEELNNTDIFPMKNWMLNKLSEDIKPE